jgi:hypothetical protein
MTNVSASITLDLVLLAFSLACAVFAAKRPAKDRGFFSLSPALRGVLAFFFGPPIIGFAIILWPITLFIWYVRRRNLAHYIDNDQMLAQLRNQGPVNRS